MKPSRFLLIAVSITFTSCLYVSQQTEILRLAYVGQKKKAAFEDLLDKIGLLRYNLEQSISLVRIGGSASKTTGFRMPDDYRLVRVSSQGAGISPKEKEPRRVSMAYRLFGIKRQAEAKTIP
jgi:hypothetical protein